MVNRVTAAIRAERETLLAQGLKVCSRTDCVAASAEQPVANFYKNPQLKDGYSSYCKACAIRMVGRYQATERGRAVNRQAVAKIERTDRGRAKHRRYRQSARGKETYRRYYAAYPEKKAARLAVAGAIRAGLLPPVNTVACSVCGLRQSSEYHHHLGYEEMHWLDVVAVCKDCHRD